VTLTRRAVLRAGVATAAGAPLLPTVRAVAAEVHATNPADLSLLEVLGELEARRLSAVELTEACLARIDALEPTLLTFVTRTDERALAAAEAADQQRANGDDPGLLGGVPVGLKDLYYTAEIPTTASSRVLADFVPDFDATVWTRLAERGAGLAGKLNTHEFAYGTSTPPTRNPWDPERNPGGSSGGSGAALGARMLPVATGGDPGGALGLPAAVNGICAIRPTYGAVSRRGIIALAWSLDTVAPMARRMADVSLLLATVAGHDPADPTSSDISLGELPLAPPSLAGVRVGVPDDYFWDDVDAGIAAVCRDGLALLERLGAQVVDVPVPGVNDQLMATFGPFEQTVFAEATSYHRGLVRSDRAAGYSPEIAALLADGETITAADYLDAQRLRSVYAGQWREIFDEHGLDAIAHPTTPEHPLPQVPSQSFVFGPPFRLMRTAPMCGFPSLSVPVGFDGDLPVGLCLTGLPFEDARLLGIGVAVDEEVALWRVRPPLVEALG
jgi:aspartyl-tRNA(Asn)/glutamyl-tRNA(Gln) amidotransferase subunit A